MIRFLSDPGSTRPFPPLMERSILAALLAIFILINLLSYQIQPVFSDEPCYTDPAASYILGRGFTSGAWYAQPDGEFFASNVPLHELALIPWLKVFGFGIVQSRSINWLYSIIGILLIWDAIRRAGWVTNPALRLAFCAVTLLTESAYSLNQLGRPDGITFLIAAMAIWAWVLPSPLWRRGLLFAAGIAASWAGLQLIAAFFLICIIGVGIWRLKWITDMIALGFGIIIGLLGLFVLYQHQGVWGRFTESVAPNAGNSARDIYAFSGFFSDRSFLLLAVCFGMIFIRTLCAREPSARKPAIFGTALLLGLPLGLLAFGKFSSHYTWMPALACTLCAAAALERSRPGKLFGSFACGFVLLAVVVGYPRRTGLALVYADDALHAKSHQFVADHITNDDRVIYAAQAYFAVKRITAKSYYYNWYPAIMSEAEAAAVTVMIIEPRTFSELQSKVGGQWRSVGEPMSYPVRRFPNRDTWVELLVYKRL